MSVTGLKQGSVQIEPGIPGLFVKYVLGWPGMNKATLDKVCKEQSLLSARQIEDEAYRVSRSQFANLLLSFVAEGQAPKSIWEQALAIPMGSFGSVGYMLLSAPSWQGWLKALFKHGVLLGLDTSRLNLKKSDSQGRLSLSIVPPKHQGERLLTLFEVASLLRLLMLSLGNAAEPLKVFIPAALNEEGLLGSMNVSLAFHAEPELQVQFPSALFEQILENANKRLFKVFEKEVEQVYQDIVGAESWTHKVRAKLRSLPDINEASQAKIAEQLFVGERTLARRLEEENTSYRDIFVAIRSTMALEYLLQGKGVEETALHLGYSERAAFERAFKKWQGKTPVQFQSQYGKLAVERDISEIIDAQKLPNIPESAAKLLNLIQDDDCDLDELSKTVEQDPVLTAKLLSFANSGLYGHLNLDSVKRIILSVVGLKRLRALTVALTASSAFTVDVEQFPYRDFWLRALAVAELSNDLAEPFAIKGSQRRDLYLAGMLHNIGHLLLAYCMPSTHKELMQELDEIIGWKQLLALQSFRFGTNSLEATEFFSRFWHMPDQISDILQELAKPAGAAEVIKRSARVIALASALFELEEINLPLVGGDSWALLQQDFPELDDSALLAKVQNLYHRFSEKLSHLREQALDYSPSS
ncbi:HDOD domain-containing protein [Aliiglaciecola sp. CAU 1673]|uniref:HDOD domain-containing protein n=1 Tax=Aliiglaciecola sp. CAU 1673 TaxID=3032595 RepID=UPI0023D97A1E|nr:HDOD domain-containing protein [Aliiglaciecola sp. CAU 1673]MDF2179657.1 HDOD domain-containing protein [Aliiglaciecola sp. CAU 1673]